MKHNQLMILIYSLIFMVVACAEDNKPVAHRRPAPQSSATEKAPDPVTTTDPKTADSTGTGNGDMTDAQLAAATDGSLPVQDPNDTESSDKDNKSLEHFEFKGIHPKHYDNPKVVSKSVLIYYTGNTKPVTMIAKSGEEGNSIAKNSPQRGKAANDEVLFLEFVFDHMPKADVVICVKNTEICKKISKKRLATTLTNEPTDDDSNRVAGNDPKINFLCLVQDTASLGQFTLKYNGNDQDISLTAKSTDGTPLSASARIAAKVGANFGGSKCSDGAGVDFHFTSIPKGDVQVCVTGSSHCIIMKSTDINQKDNSL